MKVVKLLTFFFIFIHFILLHKFVFSQDTSSKKPNNNFTDNPFQIGFEMGTLFNFEKGRSFEDFGYFGYLDITLEKSISFIKFEGGFTNSPSSDNDDNGVYFSVGYMHRLFAIDRSKLYLQLAAAVTPYPQIITSVKYLYPVNKIIGFTLEEKYPISSYQNIFLTTGFQIFTN